MKTKKTKSIKIEDKKEVQFLSLYVHFVYIFLGRRILQNKKFKSFFYDKIYNSKYESILKKANLSVYPEEYFVSIFVSLIFALIVVSILTGISAAYNSLYSVFIFYGGLISLIGIGIFFYNYPIVTAKRREAEIDASMPYLLPYMKILSKELSLSKIIEIIEDFLIYKEVRVEFQRIKHYSNFLGYDINSSIREAMQSCPSHQLSDLMNDLVTISNSGGDIYGYLDRKLSNLNTEIEALEKKNIDTLLILSQIYVVLLLIAPLFFTIMNAILNLIQVDSPGSSGLGQVDSSTFGIIFILLFFLPFLYVGFMMLVYYSKPLYARLTPIKNVEK